MPTPQDEEFIRFAVAGGHLTREQGDEALAALGEIEQLGGSASAPAMLERRGLLDTRQVGLIHEAIAASKSATRVPKVVGPFELVEKLGQGGTGTVFKARQEDRDRLVALKILAPRLARNEGYVARFRKQARAAARLTHPNIVAAVDVGHSEGFHYFATELVEGDTLAEVLRREGSLPEAKALGIALEVAAALDHANSKGVLHRDIRPENILLTRDGQVRVADFGLAKPIGRDAPPGAAAERFLGTPAYLAPEEIRCEGDIDCRADIYSLGITLFRMIAGELPFQGATPVAVAAAAVAEPVPSLRARRPEVRIATSRVVEKMTAKDRSARFATPADLHTALKSAAGSAAAPRPATAAAAAPARAGAAAAPRSAAPRRAAPRRRRSKAGSYIVAAIGIAVHVALFVWLFPKAIRHWEARQNAAQPAPTSATAPSSATEGPVYAPPTTATASPTPTVGEPVLEALRAAASRARDFARRHPRAYARQIARLRKILGDFSGQRQRDLPRAGFELLLELKGELKRVETAAAAAVTRELDSRRTRANTLFAEGKVAEALRLLDRMPPELRIDGAAPRLDSLRTQCRDRARSLLATHDARGKRLIQQDSLDQARALYAGLRAWGLPEATRRADAAVATIDKLVAERATKMQQRARERYAATTRAVVDRLAARDYGAARKLIDTALVDPELAAARHKLRPMQTLARAAADVWARAAAGVRQLKPGQAVRVGGVAGELVRVEGERVYLRFGGAVAARPLRELSSSEAVAFATRAFAKASPQVEATLGLFLLADRDYAAARRRLGGAQAKGADVAAGLDLLARFAPRPCPTCKGKGSLPCPVCEGKGYSSVERVTCPVCNGRGGGRCRKCRGRGWLRCGNCNGTGQIAGGFRCMQCGGDGRIDCPSCKKGYIRCKKCKGTGSLTKHTVCERCKGKKTIPCADCGGKGYLPPLEPAAKPR